MRMRTPANIYKHGSKSKLANWRIHCNNPLDMTETYFDSPEEAEFRLRTHPEGSCVTPDDFTVQIIL